jgi:mannose-1-phosphate guanylyltransferase/mannose-1-phosphate guanylyltransferase/mannose-6-phosphate isomerase
MIPVVLSGGSGTRLWPVSRAAFPKQFVELFDQPLLAGTLRRLAPLGEPRVVAVAGTETLTRRALAATGVPAERAVFEPAARNTAPAVALVCHLLSLEGRDREVVGVFPADHLVEDEPRFARAARLAARCALAGEVVTLGIRPTHPATGYGYIELDDEVVARDGDQDDELAAHRALRFHEKPDPAAAERMAAAGRFVWNAGMFVFRVAEMADHLARLLPETWRQVRRVEPDLGNLAEVYEAIEPVSLDVGVMERLGGHVSIPCDIGWSDVGSWDEVARIDRREGRQRGAVFRVGGGESFVFPYRDKVYGLVGVDDLLVVDTADALLVARGGRSQEVKELVAEIAAAGRPEAAEHPFEERPWGGFEVLRDTERFKSKILRVDPGQRLSYQSHRHRSEHWVIVRGRPEVTIEGELLHPAPGEAVFVPAGAKHRIANPGDRPVELVEIQVGSYFGEDDIVRYEDDYDRV